MPDKLEDILKEFERLTLAHHISGNWMVGALREHIEGMSKNLRCSSTDCNCHFCSWARLNSFERQMYPFQPVTK